MTSRRPLAKPHIEHHLLESVEDEFHALRSFVWHHWYVVLVLLVGIGLLVYVVRPFPPSTVTIATGPPDSSYDDLGEWFATYFRRNGVSLNLVASKGPVENVDLLASGKVDAAFALGAFPFRRAAASSRSAASSSTYSGCCTVTRLREAATCSPSSPACGSRSACLTLPN
jgi:hypothetical protein